jgi:hypothetical protein
MTLFQKSLLGIIVTTLLYGVFRVETVLSQVDRIIARTNRALDNMVRVEHLMVTSRATLDKANEVGSNLIEKLSKLRRSRQQDEDKP